MASGISLDKLVNGTDQDRDRIIKQLERDFDTSKVTGNSPDKSLYETPSKYETSPSREMSPSREEEEAGSPSMGGFRMTDTSRDTRDIHESELRGSLDSMQVGLSEEEQ